MALVTAAQQCVVVQVDPGLAVQGNACPGTDHGGIAIQGDRLTL